MGTKHITWADPLILGLTVFFIFCLVFESYLELPVFVEWIGRWHPLILHFPIVLLLLVAVAGIFGKKVPHLLLTVATISALLTAITGFFLGKVDGPKGDLLLWHQWMATGVTLIAVFWYWLETFFKAPIFIIKSIQLVLIILIGLTGHYGGMITHGEDFLALPRKNKEEKIPENPLVYKDVVARVLEKKCISCHNPDKRKGQLLLTGIEEMTKGGKTGPAFMAGNAEEAELIRRLRLPPQDEEHMPPEGKTPLSDNEIKILERWIALGASDSLRLQHLPPDEPLSVLIRDLARSSTQEIEASLPEVADNTLKKLTTDYVNIRRVSSNSEALSVSFFLPPDYDPEIILNLMEITPNIVEFDLSGIPLRVEEMEMVGRCKNLKRLDLDRTGISDLEFQQLHNLKNLQFLKIYATRVSDESLVTLRTLEKLQKLFIWDTDFSPEGLSKIKKALPNLSIVQGAKMSKEFQGAEKDSLSGKGPEFIN